MEQGEAARLQGAELEEARKLLGDEEQKAAARAALRAAVDAKDAVTKRDQSLLQAAIREGEAAGLDGSELDQANQALATEQTKDAARAHL